MGSDDPRTTWALDREIVLSRVFNAPRELVFRCWTEREHLEKWFGPRGFTIETQECNVRVGGRWRFVFTGPDAKTYDNRMVFLEIQAPERIVVDHGPDRDDDPTRFRMTLTFDSQSDGKTVLTLRQLHPTREQRNAGIGFGAVEFGYQTLDKLGEHLARM